MVLRDAPLRILVGALLVRTPFGAQSWHYLEYAAGLAALGHDVVVVEDSDDHEWPCYDPRTGELGTDPTYGLEFTQRAMDLLGLHDRWAYYDAHGDGWTGPAASRMDVLAREADVFLNISGVNVLRPWFEGVPRRVFVDTDPGFVQVRNLTKEAMRQATEKHNVFLTFGERYDADDCLVPDDGFAWRPTRQPVVLDRWAVTPVPRRGPFTTIMKWDSYRRQALGSLTLGMKSESFETYLDLPPRTSAELELAIGAPYPQQLLLGHGWRIRNPQVVAPDPEGFARYIRESVGEFTVAKHGYVTTRSGWFSERSAHYLASGRAVVTQDTGFSELLPTGEGLLAFSDPDGAVAALEAVIAEPERHSAAAREVAAAFDHRVVLPKLLDDVFA